MTYEPLSRKELISVIEGKAQARRVPIFAHMWVHPEEFGDRRPAVDQILNRYPEDVRWLWVRMPEIYSAPPDDPDYRWVNWDNPNKNGAAALDEQIALAHWPQLDDMLEHFPNPHYPAMTDFARNHPDDGRYRLAQLWFCFYERHWMLRGMTNALLDYYTNPDEVHRLYRALTDFYLVAMERARKEMRADGFMVSDDLGTQTGPFFSPAVFHEFFKPYYKELIEKSHALGMHFWLHCCGNITALLPDFIEIGLDVIHPIQKFAMDQAATARKFGGQITFWAGLDVQNVIPWGKPEEVRGEVRHLIDSFWRPREGRLILTFGNGVNGDCTLESLSAFLQEAYGYGSEKIRNKQ